MISRRSVESSVMWRTLLVGLRFHNADLNRTVADDADFVFVG